MEIKHKVFIILLIIHSIIIISLASSSIIFFSSKVFDSLVIINTSEFLNPNIIFLLASNYLLISFPITLLFCIFSIKGIVKKININSNIVILIYAIIMQFLIFVPLLPFFAIIGFVFP